MIKTRDTRSILLHFSIMQRTCQITVVIQMISSQTQTLKLYTIPRIRTRLTWEPIFVISVSWSTFWGLLSLYWSSYTYGVYSIHITRCFVDWNDDNFSNSSRLICIVLSYYKMDVHIQRWRGVVLVDDKLDRSEVFEVGLSAVESWVAKIFCVAEVKAFDIRKCVGFGIELHLDLVVVNTAAVPGIDNDCREREVNKVVGDKCESFWKLSSCTWHIASKHGLPTASIKGYGIWCPIACFLLEFSILIL